MRKMNSAFIKNIFFAFVAQGISLALSVFMSLIVPKVLGVEQYSYWQLFIFYVSYVGMFHFGLNDGVYLRLGGQDYEKLDYKELGGEMRILFYMQLLISGVINLVVYVANIVPERKYILFFASVYLVVSNLSLFLGYIFQAVNMTKIYSMSVIWDRVFIIVSFVILVYFKVTEFHVYVILYTISKLYSLVYCIVKGKEIIFTAKSSIKNSILWVKKDILTGINIMIANIAGNFILGIGRVVVDQRWGIESFGKFSFSLSLTSFFLLFISQVSMVLFPALRKADDTRVKAAYVKLRLLVSILLPCAFIIYVPMKLLLIRWLPAYEESLRYMVLLLPICTFDGKMQLLCNTYLKVLRREKILLKNNLIALIVSLIACLLGGYVINSIVAVAIAMVFAIAVRSIVSELYLSKMMDKTIIVQIYGECILVIIFIVVHWYLDDIAAFLLMLLSYLLYFVFTLMGYRKGEEKHA